MKDINYIIWGISNEDGYNGSISSSFNNNILPDFIKESNSTNDIRRIALAYASDNPEQNYFYSIERVDDKVLYTIYRTNWYRESRMSYDAITLIINKNYILENAALSLKKVILQYVSLKDSGVRDYDLSSIISSLKVNQKSSNQRRNISSNSTHAYLIKNDKKAFKKYTSESELNKIFIDQKSSLLNFNKVFFFTKLKYLEEGPQKLVNLNEISLIEIRLENFNYNYHTLFVDGVRSSNLMGNVFSAYEGDKVEVRKNPGNKLEKSIIVSPNQSAIVLEKIKIKKPKSVNKRRGKPSWKTKENILLMSSVFIMSLALVFMQFDTQILTFFKSFSKNTSTPTVNDDQKDSFNQNTVVKQERAILNPKDSCFYFGDTKIIDNEELASYLYKNGITVSGINYFYNTEKNKFFRFTVSKEESTKLTIDELKVLKNDINDIKVATISLKLLVKESIENYNSQINDQIIQNKNNTEQKEEIKSKNEVKKSTPKIENNNKIKDCTANKVLKKYKIRKNTTDRYIKNRLDRIIEEIKDANSSNKENFNEILSGAQEFKNQIDDCKCNLCKKIKEFPKYDGVNGLSDIIKYYETNNE